MAACLGGNAHSEPARTDVTSVGRSLAPLGEPPPALKRESVTGPYAPAGDRCCAPRGDLGWQQLGTGAVAGLGKVGPREEVGRTTHDRLTAHHRLPPQAVGGPEQPLRAPAVHLFRLMSASVQRRQGKGRIFDNIGR